MKSALFRQGVLGLLHTAALGIAAPVAALEAPAKKGAAPVDMAIEWLPASRPPILPLGASARQQDGPVSAQALRAQDLPAPAGKTRGGDDGVVSRAASASPIDTWQLTVGDRRLSMALQRWSALAGWQLVWEAERDFPMEANVQIHGTFMVALQEVMNSLADSDYPLQAVVNAQTQVLRVRRQHESTR
jgi:hypothetical protein